MHVQHYCMTKLHGANRNKRCGWHAAKQSGRNVYTHDSAETVRVGVDHNMGLYKNVSRYYLRGRDSHTMVGRH